MKNYLRKDRNFNDLDSNDVEKNEQKMPMSYNQQSNYSEDDANHPPNMNYYHQSSTNRSSAPISPSKAVSFKTPSINSYQQQQQQHQQYPQPHYSYNNDRDQRLGNGGGGPIHKQQPQPQHQILQQMFQDNPTPIYVPPFLLSNERSRAHPNHNAPLDYLPWSIANIFLCVIIAMPALFFSIQTRDFKRSGNIKKARVNSKRSLMLNITASVVGLLTIMLALILRFALYQLFVHNDVRSQNVPLIAGG